MINATLKYLKKLNTSFSNFPPVFKNTLVSKHDVGDMMKNYAKDETLFAQYRRKFISSFTLQNGNQITPLLLFNLQLAFNCRKIQHFVDYTIKKCLNSFVQSVVDAGRQTDENSNSQVVAETMKLSGKFFWLSDSGPEPTYCDRVTQRRKHTCRNNSKLIKNLYHVHNALYKV